MGSPTNTSTHLFARSCTCGTGQPMNPYPERSRRSVTPTARLPVTCHGWGLRERDTLRIMTRVALTVLAAPLFVLLGACGAKEPAPAAPATPAAAEAPQAASAEPAAEPSKPRKPFEVYSQCAEVVTVVFAADPKAANVGKRTIAPSSAIEGARNPDGNQTVWLLDDKGEPLVKVNVTRGMKRVEVGRSCRSIDAR